MANLKLNIEGLYNSLQPIKAKFEVKKKELKGNDFLKLYGALAIIAEHNKENVEELFLKHNPIERAAISDNELYLYDFEGYNLSERYVLRTLYLNQYDCVMMSVYDNKKDRYIDFVA